MARSQILQNLTVFTASTFFFIVIARVLLQDVFYVKPALPARVSTGKVGFKTNHSIRLPYEGATRTVGEILEAQWVSELWTYLTGLESRHVSLCIADSRYTDAAVNWLVSALVAIRQPLQNVLVVSLDPQLHEFFHRRGLNSVFMDPWTILKDDITLPSNFSHIWVARVVLFRLLNHWGYTVATYDSDAVLVKNPQPLFAELEDSDIVGSPGMYPFDLHRQWKSSTLCMGVVLFRASERTEKFWSLLSEVQLSLGTFDDQVVVNKALNGCGIVWNSKDTESYIHGTCRDSNLRVSLLPTSAVCRKCKNRGADYVWHQSGARGQVDKKEIAELGGMWFLKPDQDLNQGELKGVEWLRYLYSG